MRKNIPDLSKMYVRSIPNTVSFYNGIGGIYACPNCGTQLIRWNGNNYFYHCLNHDCFQLVYPTYYLQYKQQETRVA